MVLLVAQLAAGQSIPWTAVFFPLVLVPLILGTMGFAWMLASLGVFVRDIGQIHNVFTLVLMFVSPVFYPLTSLSEPYRGWLRLNPLTFIIEESRNTLLFGVMPDFAQLALMIAISLAVAPGGFYWFQKTRKGFADVL